MGGLRVLCNPVTQTCSCYESAPEKEKVFDAHTQTQTHMSESHAHQKLFSALVSQQSLT